MSGGTKDLFCFLDHGLIPQLLVRDLLKGTFEPNPETSKHVADTGRQDGPHQPINAGNNAAIS
jgi:hypothetical protein